MTWQGETGELVEAWLKDRVDAWLMEAQSLDSSALLGYEGQRDDRTLGLLRRPGLAPWELFTCPTSLRDVEPSVNLVLREDGTRDDLPDPARAVAAAAETT